MTQEAVMRERIAQLGQGAVAERMKMSRSRMSRIVCGESGVLLGEIEPMLALLGLSIVELTGPRVTVARAEYAALLRLAQRQISADLRLQEAA